MAEKIIVPVANINGTSIEELQENLRLAWRALDDALNALAKTAPHGRDYQTMPIGSFEHARHDYRGRYYALEKVQTELMAIWEGLEAQKNG